MHRNHNPLNSKGKGYAVRGKDILKLIWQVEIAWALVQIADT